jgi:Flp pilus assembly protein TadD
MGRVRAAVQPFFAMILAAAVALPTLGCATERDIIGQALVLTDRGRYADARALIEKRLATHPEDQKARRLLVRVSGLEGDLGRARRAAEDLAAHSPPGSPEPWVELGYALELAHRYDEALALYDRASELAPRNPLGPKTGGMRAARWGERELARPRLEEALRRDSRDAEAWHALGLVCLGLGDHQSAEQAYRSGLMADPHALENRVGLATLAFAQSRPELALHEYEAILAERPKQTAAMLGRSLALIQMGRLDDAESALSEAAARGADRDVIRRQREHLARTRQASKAARERMP